MKTIDMVSTEQDPTIEREPESVAAANEDVLRYMRQSSEKIGGLAQPTSMELAFARVEAGLVGSKKAA